MSATILNGKELAKTIRAEIKEKILMQHICPKLAVILAGDDTASEIYVKNKQKAAEEVGIETVLFKFDEKVSQKEIESLIEKLNENPLINGILVQLPLPEKVNQNAILQKIDPKKDVDGFHPLNIGLLQNGNVKGTIAATPKGVMRLLKQTKQNLKGKNALVIGRSVIVGKPMAMLLLNEDCTVTIAHSYTKNLPELIKQADIVVSACGCANLIKGRFIKEGAVIIDVGINRIRGKLCGDVCFEEALDVAGFITPVPGGVGPMTIAMLLENTLEACLKQAKANA